MFRLVAVCGLSAALALVSACDPSPDVEGPTPDFVAPADAATDAADAAGDAGPAPVCEPGHTRCAGVRLETCTPDGLGYGLSTCPPGQGCRAGSCIVVRPNVVVLFDTSGSMQLTQEAAEIPAADPGCSGVEASNSRLAMAKQLFTTLFSRELSTRPRFVLTRFPQGLVAGEAGCTLPRHVGLSNLPGDDNVHVAPDDVNAWFRRDIEKFLAVPYPRTSTQSNRVQLLSWLDGIEASEPTGESCDPLQPDCGALSFCAVDGCRDVSEPELRADGGTPLGKTLFYVGELFRQFILVDGRFCLRDSDCGSPEYECDRTNRCVDPLAHCRTNAVLVFTDGQENAVPTDQTFFAAIVQAKRYAWGLGCQDDADCLAGAACGPGGTCTSPAFEAARATADPEGRAAGYREPGDANVLRRADGTPVKLRVHVLDAWGTSEGRAVAAIAGGEYVAGTLTNPQPILARLELLFAPKDPTATCE